MITQPPQQRRGRAAVLVLGVALVGVVALATSRAAPHALFSSLFKKKDRVSFEDATASSQYLELPEGCKIRGGMIINLMNGVIDTALNHQKLPTPPDPQKERKMISMETGTSLVMYNKSTTAMHVGHIEVATCWIPGPEGNKILPDRLAVTVTGVLGTQHLQYDLEQNFFGFTHGMGGGEMKVTVTGFLHLPLIDLHDLNNTVKGCTGKVGMQSMWASGPHGIEGDPVALDRADVVADQQMIHDMCYGPAYWDDSFGPKPPGLVGAINEQIRKRFFKGYVAPPPPPSPPFDCDCSWTDKFPCPGTQPGERALKQAKDDGSACFHHCCPPLNLVDHVDLNPNAYYDHEPASAA
ncbi:hypothetical protein EMIHUDRAFT_421733 [Emiliania huxleyi CCMP1516]|uniref:Uncharacterized protein n=2 Tax=Emiliania huxleyi TaxID=2903 RepID=A0A0D3J2H4_EMIH1|nr:hypothetical protein EMIHUDRAFT_421733 [Emiliania huxleyi CCMP1516]EOD17709.1 hypothetical protein EMIHUDRAFT_421733 [Emiliania huxleyi CCMP1516]|eukprot:XP_005770138.1 hypothetical protein EMIHUDRAFT_421733 [Emiliania huxleyi CCMP1516]